MFKEVMNVLWLARISSLSNEVGLYVVLLEVLLFMPNSLIRHSVFITDKESCKFAVNKRQNTNYSFLPVTSKVSCIRKKLSQNICLQGNN